MAIGDNGEPGAHARGDQHPLRVTVEPFGGRRRGGRHRRASTAASGASGSSNSDGRPRLTVVIGEHELTGRAAPAGSVPSTAAVRIGPPVIRPRRPAAGRDQIEHHPGQLTQIVRVRDRRPRGRRSIRSSAPASAGSASSVSGSAGRAPSRSSSGWAAAGSTIRRAGITRPARRASSASIRFAPPQTSSVGAGQQAAARAERPATPGQRHRDVGQVLGQPARVRQWRATRTPATRTPDHARCRRSRRWPATSSASAPPARATPPPPRALRRQQAGDGLTEQRGAFGAEPGQQAGVLRCDEVAGGGQQQRGRLHPATDRFTQRGIDRPGGKTGARQQLPSIVWLGGGHQFQVGSAACVQQVVTQRAGGEPAAGVVDREGADQPGGQRQRFVGRRRRADRRRDRIGGRPFGEQGIEAGATVIATVIRDRQRPGDPPLAAAAFLDRPVDQQGGGNAPGAFRVRYRRRERPSSSTVKPASSIPLRTTRSGRSISARSVSAQKRSSAAAGSPRKRRTSARAESPERQPHLGGVAGGRRPRRDRLARAVEAPAPAPDRNSTSRSSGGDAEVGDRGRGGGTVEAHPAARRDDPRRRATRTAQR